MRYLKLLVVLCLYTNSPAQAYTFHLTLQDKNHMLYLLEVQSEKAGNIDEIFNFSTELKQVTVNFKTYIVVVYPEKLPSFNSVFLHILGFYFNHRDTFVQNIKEGFCVPYPTIRNTIYQKILLTGETLDLETTPQKLIDLCIQPIEPHLSSCNAIDAHDTQRVTAEDNSIIVVNTAKLQKNLPPHRKYHSHPFFILSTIYE